MKLTDLSKGDKFTATISWDSPLQIKGVINDEKILSPNYRADHENYCLVRITQTNNIPLHEDIFYQIISVSFEHNSKAYVWNNAEIQFFCLNDGFYLLLSSTEDGEKYDRRKEMRVPFHVKGTLVLDKYKGRFFIIDSFDISSNGIGFKGYFPGTNLQIGDSGNLRIMNETKRVEIVRFTEDPEKRNIYTCGCKIITGYR